MPTSVTVPAGNASTPNCAGGPPPRRPWTRCVKITAVPWALTSCSTFPMLPDVAAVAAAPDDAT